MSRATALHSSSWRDQQAIRPGPGIGPGRLRRQRRRGRRPGRRQRRRQVDAGQDDRRHPLGRRGHDPLRRRRRSRSPDRRTRPNLGIATVYQDLALCDNLDVVANLFLGREEVSPGVGTVSRQLDEVRMEHRDRRAALEPGGDDPQPAQRGRHALRRPAPAGRGGPLAARRAEGRAARRADGGARRRPDQTGAGADPAPARARARRRRDQPQPGRRLRGRRPHLRPAPRPRGRRVRAPKRRPRSTSSRAITGVGGDGRDERRRRRTAIRHPATPVRGRRSDERRGRGTAEQRGRPSQAQADDRAGWSRATSPRSGCCSAWP